MDRKPIKFLLDMFRQKGSRSSEQKYNLNHKSRVIAPQIIPGLEPVYRPGITWIKRRLPPFATVSDLNNVEVVIPTTFPSNLSIWLVHKTDGFWKITVDYCKIKQVMTPTAGAADVVSSYEQIITLIIIILICQILSSPYLLTTSRSSLLPADIAGKTLSLTYLSSPSLS